MENRKIILKIIFYLILTQMISCSGGDSDKPSMGTSETGNENLSGEEDLTAGDNSSTGGDGNIEGGDSSAEQSDPGSGAETGDVTGSPDVTGEDTGTPAIPAQNKKRFGGDLLWYGVSANSHDVITYFREAFTDLNMETARFDIYWGKLEPERGVYDWTLADELVSSVANGTEILFTIYSTSRWGSKHNNCRELSISSGMNEDSVYNNPPSSVPEDIFLEDYSKFLEALVSRYKDRVKFWQIENEVYGITESTILECSNNEFWLGTKEEYGDLLSLSYTKIKQIDPDATVAASSIAFGSSWPAGNVSTDFLDYTLDSGRDYTDFIDIHLYGCVQDVPDKINSVKEKITLLGYTKPFWSTETGDIDILCYTSPEYTTSLELPEELKIQSGDLIKRHALAFDNDIEKIYRLKMTAYNDWDAAKNRWNHMGFSYYSDVLVKKPAYYTYQIMTSKLKNFTDIEKISNNVYKFTFSDKPAVYTAWSTVEETLDMSNYIQTGSCKISYIVTELNLQKGAVYLPDLIVPAASIPISATPVFIEEITP